MAQISSVAYPKLRVDDTYGSHCSTWQRYIRLAQAARSKCIRLRAIRSAALITDAFQTLAYHSKSHCPCLTPLSQMHLVLSHRSSVYAGFWNRSLHGRHSTNLFTHALHESWAEQCRSCVMSALDCMILYCDTIALHGMKRTR